ncbi:MAG TPA: hypothetical protein VLL75_02285 [Vicinamibacteria bacterium]|nr:hypothetical protein [Vicinamibacteria bacterium]
MTSLLLLLALVQLAPPSAPRALLFGFAKKAITPEVGRAPVYMAGFDLNRRATGVHDDLWARAVAVSDGQRRIAIVAVDLIGVFHDDTLVVMQAVAEGGPERRGQLRRPLRGGEAGRWIRTAPLPLT